MSDVTSSAPAAAMPGAGAAPTTAGSLLRQARLAQGLHIGALAASIKVTQRKLELLESDQFDQLPDATFTRALAQAVCRTLKVDAAPVLALLPPPLSHRLEQVSEGLNTPFADRPGRLVPREWASVATPALWLAALLVLGTAVVYFLPAGWSFVPKVSDVKASVAVPAPTAAPTAASMAVPLVETTAPPQAAASEPAAAAPPAASEPVPNAAAARLVEVRTTASSWIEITDASGQAVLSRLLQAGEAVPLDGALPMKVRIGNASGTQLSFRGQPVALAPFTRDNIARLELK